MSRVEELERAIHSLSPDEFKQIARIVQDLEQERWDEQLDRDAASGKLEFLRREALQELEANQLHDWPTES